jgi:hypothetical protein
MLWVNCLRFDFAMGRPIVASLRMTSSMGGARTSTKTVTSMKVSFHRTSRGLNDSLIRTVVCIYQIMLLCNDR